MVVTADVSGLARARSSTPTDVPMPPRPWRTRVLVPAAILLAILGLVLYVSWDSLLPATEVRAVPVILKSVTGDVPGTVTVQAPGWLEPDPHPTYVSTLTGGVVREVLVLEGATVKKGEIVARLIDDDARLAAQRAAAVVNERKAAVAAAQAELNGAQEDLQHLVDRHEEVAKTKAGNAAVRAERTQLNAEIQAAESLVLALQDELDRKSPLLEIQAVSAGEVARLTLELAAERAVLAAKRAAIPVLDAKQAAALAQSTAAQQRMKLLTKERLGHERAKANLARAQALEAQATTAMAEAQLALQRTEIRSPAAGVVLQRMISPGSRLLITNSPHSSHVVHLYDPKRLQVRVDVPLADSAQIGLEQRAEIVVDALPDRVFPGRVSRLVHLADVAKNTIEVKVSLLETIPVLKPEMLARVRFLASTEQTANQESPQETRQRIFAPASSIQQGSHVFLVANLSKGRGRAERRTVKLGRTKLEDYVEVLEGLRPGDHIILDVPPGLAPGDRIVITGGT